MGHLIDSDALGGVNRVLGIAGQQVPAATLLDGANLSQILNVNELVRRARTPGFTSGWFYTLFVNIHGASGELSSSIDPYVPGDASVAPYPSPVPRGFDFWLLGAAVRRTSGAGALSGAILFLNPDTRLQGWGVDDSGAAVATTSAIPLARWTGLDTGLSGTGGTGITGDGGAMVKTLTRVPREGDLLFITEASAAATFQCLMICALFVEGLGQDVAQ